MAIRQREPQLRTRSIPSKQARQRLHQHGADQRWQHELKEMQETDDLRQIDDDVEDVATLVEWQALEHRDHPRSPRWYVVLAAGTTIIAAFFLIMLNIIGAITTAFIGGLLYYIAQLKPAVVRYRFMVDGVAIGTKLYHYKDLDGFNIIYEPGDTKIILINSKLRFSPLVTMEIGDADPVALRDILLEFLPEDQTIEEPLIDIWAKRFGF